MLIGKYKKLAFIDTHVKISQNLAIVISISNIHSQHPGGSSHSSKSGKDAGRILPCFPRTSVPEKQGII